MRTRLYTYKTFKFSPIAINNFLPTKNFERVMQSYESGEWNKHFYFIFGGPFLMLKLRLESSTIELLCYEYKA